MGGVPGAGYLPTRSYDYDVIEVSERSVAATSLDRQDHSCTRPSLASSAQMAGSVTPVHQFCAFPSLVALAVQTTA